MTEFHQLAVDSRSGALIAGAQDNSIMMSQLDGSEAASGQWNYALTADGKNKQNKQQQTNKTNQRNKETHICRPDSHHRHLLAFSLFFLFHSALFFSFMLFFYFSFSSALFFSFLFLCVLFSVFCFLLLCRHECRCRFVLFPHSILSRGSFFEQLVPFACHSWRNSHSSAVQSIVRLLSPRQQQLLSLLHHSSGESGRSDTSHGVHSRE